MIGGVNVPIANLLANNASASLCFVAELERGHRD